ncbi:hypothetical protein [Streptomyces sp. NPDC005953]|uniref:hypothetical protein n=1 Tax=Streptomyces sp. NPDC005953 TaxID=3156719 RepID=UPI0033FAD6B6
MTPHPDIFAAAELLAADVADTIRAYGTDDWDGIETEIGYLRDALADYRTATAQPASRPTAIRIDGMRVRWREGGMRRSRTLSSRREVGEYVRYLRSIAGGAR